jgi:hypothetical protein
MAGLSPVDGERWRWAAASQIGSAHQKLGIRKQDAWQCFVVGRIFCAIVCDGAGSAQFGGEGASVVCRIASTAIRSHLRETGRLWSDEEAWRCIDLVRDTLAHAAERRHVPRRNFASTLIMLVAAPEDLMIVHIGDGAVVARDQSGVWRALSWPESGEYASSTYFVTDDPAPRVRFTRFQESYDGFAVFSDGIENVALDLQAKQPHEPFFRSMLNPLDRMVTTLGKNFELSQALSNFLGSERLCAKTDDDKTLIICSGR